MKNVISFAIKLLKAIVSVAAAVIFIGGLLYLMDSYVMPAYNHWSTGELWFSEYSSIGLKEAYLIGFSLLVVVGSLFTITKLKNV